MTSNFNSNFAEEHLSEENSDTETNSKIKRGYNKKSKEKVKRWTEDECYLYENFIHMYSEIMTNSSSKRNSKIFLLMSKFISKYLNRLKNTKLMQKSSLKIFSKNFQKY